MSDSKGNMEAFNQRGQTHIEVTSEVAATLIDSMGDDESVVHAARVSIVGAKAETESGEKRGLLNFLMSNRHSSVFEHVTAKFMLEVPIFVAREVVRHRTFCLAAETPITCVQPNGTPYQRTVEHLYKTHLGTHLFRSLHIDSNERVRQFNQVRQLRVFDEESRKFTTGNVDNIFQSGVKEVYEIRTKGSHLKSSRDLVVRASADHPFLTSEGWVKVKDLSGDELIVRPGKIATSDLGRQIPPSLRQGIGVWTSMLRPRLIGEGTACYICNDFFEAKELELDHIVSVHADLNLALNISNIAPACIPCHRRKTNKEQPPKTGVCALGEKRSKLYNKPILVAESMTYDIEMEGPNHNYLADHLVVHNSYNETSGRYSVLPPKFYSPPPSRPLQQVGKPGKYTFTEGTKEQISNTEITLKHAYMYAWDRYQDMLRWGIAKEVARDLLPVGIFTSFYMTGNLRNWLSYLSLRTAPDALFEIREVSRQIEEQLETVAPTCVSLWREHGRNSL